MRIWERLLETLRIRTPRHIYFYALIVGIVSGLSAVAFSYGLGYAERLLLHGLGGLHVTHPPGELHIESTFLDEYGLGAPYMLLFLPALGGLCVGLILRYFYSETSGAGTDSMVRAFHHREGMIKKRAPFFKALGTILTLSTGGSGGREGPTAFIGAGIGSGLSRLLRSGARARRTLLLAGTAGGLGAIFRAPLGGAIAAMEILYLEDIESDALVPCIVASVTGYLTFQVFTGPGSLFQVGELGLSGLHELPVYLLLGLFCYPVGYIYVKFFHMIRKFFSRLRIPIVLKPAIGGLVIGLLALTFPEVIGSGMGYIQRIIAGESPLPQAPHMQVAFFFLLIAGLKIVATAFTIGSGGSGGLFAPSLFIGAMLGGFVANVTLYFMPEYEISTAAFAIVGMGAFFAGVARAPFAAMIMVSDIIGSYALLPPLMIVCMIALILTGRWTLYQQQLKNRFQSPAHFWDMQLDVLNQLRIEEHFPEFRSQAIIDRRRLLGDLETFAFDIQASDFVVTNSDGTYFGMISLKKVRITTELESVRALVTVDDAAEVGVPAVGPDSSLGDALKIITECDYDKAVIVDEDRMVLGYIRYNDIFAVYHQYLKRPQGTAGGPTPRRRKTDAAPGTD